MGVADQLLVRTGEMAGKRKYSTSPAITIAVAWARYLSGCGGCAPCWNRLSWLTRKKSGNP